MKNNPILIYETIYGSRAYNLDRRGSDTDIKGVIVGPKHWYHGFCGGPEQIEFTADHVHLEIRKFFRLANAANPTILEMLWTEPSDHITVTNAGRHLLDNRQLLLTQKTRDTFSGYALSQLKRIKTHRRWLRNPPGGAPSRAEYGLPEHNIISKDQLGAAQKLMEDQRLEEAEITPNFLDILDRENRYRRAREQWKQFCTWQKQRNPDRAKLEAKFGYDTKNAMHLVRLQRMAVEILTENRVVVKRPDRQELLAIRDGVWSYDELIAQCETLEERIGEAAKHSNLPLKADEEVMNKLCCDIVEEVLYAGS